MTGMLILNTCQCQTWKYSGRRPYAGHIRNRIKATETNGIQGTWPLHKKLVRQYLACTILHNLPFLSLLHGHQALTQLDANDHNLHESASRALPRNNLILEAP